MIKHSFRYAIGIQNLLSPWLWVMAWLLSDQVSKQWIIQNFNVGEFKSVLVWRALDAELLMHHVTNPGISFGLFQGYSANPLIMFTGALCIALAVMMQTQRAGWARSCLCLMLGGALGNLVDRIQLGYVTDFIHVRFQDWDFWIFNLADVYLSVGVGIFIIANFFTGAKVNHAK